MPVRFQINHEVAEQLYEIARLLELQGADPFRVRAYYNAATTIENLNQSVQDVVDREGLEGLIALPTIGTGIGRSVYEYVATGRMTRLESLRGESDPIGLFKTIPGVGSELARRIHETLHLDSLEALEMAVRNGRLTQVPGLGDKRVKGIQAWLATVLGGRRTRAGTTAHPDDEPSIPLLLKVDREYREKSASGTLPTIAPKRFNPSGEAWLPVMHVTHGDWHFTALYSNTALAHELNRTQDWVVVYFYDNHHQEGQHTVVTETRGPLVGNRVVRGRERECREYYAIDSVSA